MFLIIVYDVNVKRVNKVCSFLKMFLFWRQNSFFEGEVTESQFHSIKEGLKDIINPEEDSIFFYILPSKKSLKVEVLGLRKGRVEDNII